MLTEQDVRKMVIDRINHSGSQKAFSDETGLSTGYINDYIHFKRDAGPSLLAVLGLTKVNMYQRIRLQHLPECDTNKFSGRPNKCNCGVSP